MLQTRTKEQSFVIGKGTKKRELFDIRLAYESYDADEIINDGGFDVYTFNTGATLDTPFAMRLLQMEITCGSYTANSAVTYATGTAWVGAEEFTPTNGKCAKIAAYGNVVERTGFYREYMEASTGQHGVVLHKEHFDEAKTRVIAVPDIQLGIGAYSQDVAGDNHLDWGFRFVFEKVKMTKAEYMEKLALRQL